MALVGPPNPPPGRIASKCRADDFLMAGVEGCRGSFGWKADVSALAPPPLVTMPPSHGQSQQRPPRIRTRGLESCQNRSFANPPAVTVRLRARVTWIRAADARWRLATGEFVQCPLEHAPRNPSWFLANID